MIVKIWQHSNVNVNEQPVKVLLNPNVQVGILKSQYPQATTPLSNTDKFLVRQGNDWNEVGKSELGGGGSDTVRFFITFRLKLDKTGNNYTVEEWSSVGTLYEYYQSFLNITPAQLLTHPYIRGFKIDENYKLKSVDFFAKHARGEIDATLTIIRKALIDDIPVTTFLNDGEIITEIDFQFKKNYQVVKHFDINSNILTKANDVISLAWKKTDGTPDASNDIYVHNCGLLMEFKK